MSDELKIPLRWSPYANLNAKVPDQQDINPVSPGSLYVEIRNLNWRLDLMNNEISSIKCLLEELRDNK